MNKKGFTLLELLAAIVVLSVIAVIALPKFIEMVTTSEIDSVKTTANLLAKAAQDHYSNEVMEFRDVGKVNLADDTILYNGDRPEKGYAFFDEEGRAFVKMYYKGYCVSRKHNGQVLLTEMKEEDCEVLNVVTLTLYPNGGNAIADENWTISGSYISTTIETSTKITNLPKVSKEGYTLLGWYDETNKGFDLNGTITENTILRAKWQVNTYVVKIEPKDFTIINANGWTSTNGNYQKVITYDAKYGTLPVAQRAGFQFKGWATSGGVTLNANSVLKIASDHTLIPLWDSNMYTVTLKYGNGTPDKTIQVKYNSVYGGLGVPTRDGYTFTGWFTAESGGTEITADTPVTILGAQTLYARWVKN